MLRRRARRRSRRWRWLAFGLAAGLVPPSAAAEPVDRPVDGTAGVGERPPSRRNLTMKTLGGRQYWGDLVFLDGWRIQRNVFTGHCRLLDRDDFRYASGSRRACAEKLDEFQRQRKVRPMHGTAVVLIHGIVRSAKSFDRMAGRLREDGYVPVGFSYPSTRLTIEAAAGYLDSVVRSLDGIDVVHIVGHSMGGLVTRAYLEEYGDPRIGRIVMIGVPNRGAEMADMLQSNPLYRAIMGPAGQQLVTAADGLIGRLPVPECEFGVVAGGRNDAAGFNPLIPGDDDGTVAVASTRLAGASDFLLVPGLHSFLMGRRASIEATSRFLRTGRFREHGPAQPVPKEE